MQEPPSIYVVYMYIVLYMYIIGIQMGVTLNVQIKQFICYYWS